MQPFPDDDLRHAPRDPARFNGNSDLGFLVSWNEFLFAVVLTSLARQFSDLVQLPRTGAVP